MRLFRMALTWEKQLSNILKELSVGYRPYVFLILIVFGFALPPAINLQPLDRDEARFMQATTQMFETGDFVQIRFQDVARNKKPIGIHWFQTIALKLSGDPLARNPLPFRMVSILGAILCALATFKIGEILVDRRAGLLAGSLIASSLLLSTEAHIAKTDAALAGFIALAFLGLAKLKFETPKFSNVLLFWFAFAVAILIKGPVPIMVIGLALIAMAGFDRNIKWAKPLLDFRAISLFLAIILPWFIAIGIVTDWQFYKDAIGQDLAPKLNGTSENKPIPPGLHTLLAPILLWPGSLLLGVAIWAGIKFRKDANVRFLLAWIIPAWLVFELSPAKLAHYTLPTHAAIAVLAALGLANDGWKSKTGKWLGLGLYSFGLLIVTFLPIYLMREYSHLSPNLGYAAAALIGGSGLIALAFALKNSFGFVPFALVSALSFAVLVKALILPNLPALDVSRQVSNALVAHNLHPRLSPNMTGHNLIGAGYQEPSLIFLTQSSARLDSVESAVNSANNGDAAIIEDSQLEKFKTQLPKPLIFKQSALVKGLNYSKGDDVVIHVGAITIAE